MLNPMRYKNDNTYWGGGGTKPWPPFVLKIAEGKTYELSWKVKVMKKKGANYIRGILYVPVIFLYPERSDPFEPFALTAFQSPHGHAPSSPQRCMHSITSACFILSIYISFCQYVAFKNTLFYQNFFFFFWQCSFPHTHDILSSSSLENLTILFAIWQCAVN